MKQFHVRLRALVLSDETEAREAHREMIGEGFHFLLDARTDEDWASYVNRLEMMSRPIDTPADRVPATFLVAEVDSRIAGRVSIRHELNATLQEVGGHIGYGVRPAMRRQGHASEMLRQALQVVRAVDINQALLTCYSDNSASITTRVTVDRRAGSTQDTPSEHAPGRTQRPTRLTGQPRATLAGRASRSVGKRVGWRRT